MSAPFAAVAGWPAQHSLSPLMMRTWLDALRLKGDYGRIEITPDKAAVFFKALPDLGWAGLNVTLPHKQTALAAADNVTAAAQRIGAANLLTVDGSGRVHADNTDIIGVQAGLAEHDPSGPVVLIGAGGAARAALFYLQRQDREVVLVNRTQSKAETLAAELEARVRIVQNLDDALAGAALVINATSLGMAGQPSLEPDLSLTRSDALIFDMVYSPLKTALLKQARRSGRRTADGLSMLIGQARPSFKVFFGAEPPADKGVRDTLIAHLEETP